jgi:transposase
MMGQTANQDQLFYAFNLEEHIPPGHLLRGVNRFLDLSSLRDHLAPFYSHTGRPSIDPELMIRMLVIGYCFGIRSERRLCEEVHLNLAYRWFCQLGLEDKIPDHSTFSKNRHGRFRESETFRHVFEAVLRRCMSEGLVGGEGFAVDASVIKADANRANVTTPEVPKDWPGGDVPSRAVRDYLTALDENNPIPPDAAPTATPRVVSLSDPQARYTAAPGGPAFFAYSTNYLIDLDAGIIVDVEATPAHRTQEVESTKTMVQRVEERFDIKPKRLVGDTAYGTAPMLNWMVNEKQIEPHVRVWDRTQRKDDTLGSSEFAWDEQANEYRCPEGLSLKSN